MAGRRAMHLPLGLIAMVIAATSVAMPVAAADSAVQAKDDSFITATIKVDPGATLTWTNAGRNTHNVIADDGSFQSRNLAPGASFSVKFAKKGRFTYFCSLHGDRGGKGMSGVVLVGLSEAEVSSTSATHTYPATPPVRPPGGRTIHVPADNPTIQAAVDAAKAGDLVLVAAGTYNEAVKVTTANITIRGEDRNRVILDGRLDPGLKNGIAVFGADGVAVENMTAHGYQLNGFYWRSVWGYRGSYLTAYDNGDYGIYAFDAGVGMFDHSWASGNPDSGFYIGQCDPCNALITDVVSANNGLGYSGTNGSGNLVIRNSEWRDNMAGIVPNTLDSEALPPQHSVTVVGNWVHDNHNRRAPGQSAAYGGFGEGILLAGGNDNEVAGNLVEGHPFAGIASVPNLDKNFWFDHGNRIHDNVVRRSGVADLALMGPAQGGNCFARNDFSTSMPPAIESVYGCGSPVSALGGGDLGLTVNQLGFFLRSTGDYPHGDWRTQAAPPDQPSMPDSSGTPAAVGPPQPIDPAVEVRAAVSARQAGVAIPGAPRPTSGLSRGGPTFGNLVFSFVDYALPFLFLVALALRLTRATSAPWLTGRRALIGLPLLYLIATVGILASGYID